MSDLYPVPETHLAPSVRPRTVATYEDTGISMEDRFLMRMRMAENKPRKVEKDDTPTQYSPEEHKEIRAKVIEVCSNGWMTSIAVAKAVGADLQVVRSKLSSLVNQEILIVSGPKTKRRYKINPDCPDKGRKKREFEERVNRILELIKENPGSQRKHFIEATGLTPGQVDHALKSIVVHNLARCVRAGHGRANTFYPLQNGEPQ